jgi:hypothetical protein
LELAFLFGGGRDDSVIGIRKVGDGIMRDLPKVLSAYSGMANKAQPESGMYILGKIVGAALIIGMGLMGVGAIITAIVPSTVEHGGK